MGEASFPDGRDVVWKAKKKSDLILDNLGRILAGEFRAPVNAVTTCSVTDTGGTARTIQHYGSNSWTAMGTQVVGTRLGVGSSSVAPARTQYNLQAQLGSWSDTTTGVWTSATGQITFAGSVLLAAGGTVREVGVIGVWIDSGAAVRSIMIFRDVITDVVIGAGKYAFVQYTVQL